MDLLSNVFLKTLLDQSANPTFIINVAHKSQLIDKNKAYNNLLERISLLTKANKILKPADFFNAEGKIIFSEGISKCIELKEKITLKVQPSYSETRENILQVELLPIIDDQAFSSYIIIIIYENIQQDAEKADLLSREQNLNEELATMLEEMEATNEELNQAQQALVLINQDLEERVKDRTKELQISEARLKYMITEAPVGIAVLKGKQHILELANLKMLELIDKTDSIVGFPFITSIPELADQVYPKILDEVFETGKPIYGEASKVLLKRDGQIREGYYSFVNYPLKDSNGVTESIMIVASEVTEEVLSRAKVEKLNESLSIINQKLEITNADLLESNRSLALTQNNLERILEELYKSENRFRGFFEKAPLGMCVLKGRELITEFANDNILALWGKKRNEVIGLPQEVARPEVANQREVLNKIKNIFNTGKPLYIDALKVSTLVKEGYFNATYQPLNNDQDEVTSILVIISDVTDQANYRKELEKAKDILKLAMDASSMGSWNIDLISKKLILSERAQRIYGLETNRLDLDLAKALVADEHLEYLTGSLKKALHNRTAFNIEYKINPTGGNQAKWLRSTGKTYYDSQDKALYIAGAVLDITEQKEEELRKNDFIGMISHELRTPLTSLSAYIQLLQYKLKEDDNIFTKETLTKVSIQLKRMSGMVDGFLNVSVLESGNIKLQKSNFDLIELIKSIAEENRVLMPGHFIQVIGEQNINICADQQKIGNVINNLISNAAKYSRKDSLIALKCEIIGDFVQVSIEDEGIGIHKEDQSKLFNRFFRVDSPNTKTIAGFGVGLYICEEIIKKHQGKIWMESEMGKGSTFYFIIPLIGASTSKQ
ncbi:ATP-binding protein [Pedobacter fastidiosus]|uniref:histidine kinase n=1 Tax=Pedobacter fastidiosus TaxID=2765361 RepID=A0ABR7KSU4_9SPHI|nr:ATP-binding protein [Pedobacter fastidiosus]MBC6110857.1 PAS domain S-box protein [Pedobacter fastidiosus]